MNPAILIVIVIVVVLVAVLVGIYNGLVQKRLRIDEAFAQIEVQLKRRHDLIPNLVNAVKGYMGFEQKVLTDVTNARAAAVAAGAQGPAQQAAAENALTGTLRSLFAVVENYPELKANQNVLELQEQLTTTENQISFSRQHYNATVLDYNTGIQTFPAVLIAGIFGFIKRDFFDAEPEADARPERRPQPELTRPPRDMTVADRSSFYDQISANKRNSFLLAAFVVVLLGVLGFAIGYAIVGGPDGRPRRDRARAGDRGRSRGRELLRRRQARPGGRAARARSTQTVAPQLMNVVQELAIAANVPMPKVYIIDDTAPNAFATGRDPKHASLAITTGLLEKLDREELQGVIGHELSHVRNFDIRFSLIVGVMVGVDRDPGRLLPALHVLGRRAPVRAATAAATGIQAVIMIVAIVLAILAPIISRFIQLAVSRQREYLADASCVELTRNPYGLERALAKIGSDQEVLEVANRGTQHLYFTNPIKKFEARSSGLMVDPPADPRPDQPAARADRRGAAPGVRRRGAGRAGVGERSAACR